MCGIVGICRLRPGRRIRLDAIRRMMAPVCHRGPDATGVYLDNTVGLGHLRLSIIDLASGCQPMANEDETLWIVYNGEVFNYLELRDELREQGHRFRTTSDTEVVLHLYEQLGPRCLERLNGEFAFAVWDSRNKELFLARDRVGIRPLHYTFHAGTLLFASEIKSLFALPGVSREFDPVSLDQIFTFWSVLPGRTPFRYVHELPPGHWMKVSPGGMRIGRYWQVPVYARQEQLCDPLESLCEQAMEVLTDAVRLRLRADVPVGSYLSGGLDSSAIAALAAGRLHAGLNTFGIRFEHEDYDEGVHQQVVASFLGTRHREVWATPSRIGDHFARTVWHAEKPLLRTAPVPLYLLSGAVQEVGLKVVLTGEGADEVFGGYDIFKEAKVRRFWARRPDAVGRAALFGQLYESVFRDSRVRPFLSSFFARGLNRLEDPLFSHLIRWENTRRIKAFFSGELRAAIGESDPYEPLRQMLPERYDELDGLGKAQCLETMVFLSNYLLSSQGDRMAMAHSIETRLPFLDYRVMDLAARIPARWKILGLDEKHILKRMFRSILPPEIVARRKQPYRAPVADCLLVGPSREFALDMLAPGAIRGAGLFDEAKVGRLVAKLQMSDNPGEVDSMALTAILSSQIVHHQFVENPPGRSRPDLRPDRVIDRRSPAEAAAAQTAHCRRTAQRCPSCANSPDESQGVEVA